LYHFVIFYGVSTLSGKFLQARAQHHFPLACTNSLLMVDQNAERLHVMPAFRHKRPGIFSGPFRLFPTWSENTLRGAQMVAFPAGKTTMPLTAQSPPSR
jgi:hypothetical protein